MNLRVRHCLRVFAVILGVLVAAPLVAQYRDQNGNRVSPVDDSGKVIFAPHNFDIPEPSAARELRPTLFRLRPFRGGGCPVGHTLCVRSWGGPVAENDKPELTYSGGKLGAFRCEFLAGTSARSSLTARDLEKIERSLRFDTYRRIEAAMQKHADDFAWARLVCISLEHSQLRGRD